MGYFGGSPLVMFFYGTLKRGERNHEHFCGGALRIEEGAVRGDLFDVQLGYPALVVPEESICAFGTGDYRRDAEEQQRLGRGPVPLLEGPRVFGEIFAFDDPESRLPDLDRLEGFDPADVSSNYRRVLLPVEKDEGSGKLSWAFSVEISCGCNLTGVRWTP